MRYQEAISSLKYKRETKFILIGQETFLKEYFIKIARLTYPDYEYQSFYADDSEELTSFIFSESLFSNNLMVIRALNKLNTENLIDFIPSFNGLIIFALPEKTDMKSRPMTEIMGKVQPVECHKLKEYGNDYPLWIISKCDGAGYTLKDEAENIIYSRIGSDMFMIANELNKLFLLKGPSKEIYPQDVLNSVSTVSVKSPFDIIDSLIKKDIKGALENFESYSRVQDTFKDLLSFIGISIEKMYRMLLLKETKIESDDIAEIVGIPRFLVKTKYLPRAMALGKNFLSSKLNELCDLDASIRIFKGPKKILVEKFIINFNS